ncbi:MAG TPA: phosphomannose isomerase type II C-terminal cupin domain [Pyrinomonadaceae bacterium]
MTSKANAVLIGLMRYYDGEVAAQRIQEPCMAEAGMDTSAKFDRRPWGTFTVLDEGENFKVKRIEVLPGKRLSYQKHAQRAEHWFVVQGTAKVTLDDREINVSAGEAIDIAVGSAHRVENSAEELLVFIEVQRGSYLGEDDIVRLQDDFGRTS